MPSACGPVCFLGLASYYCHFMYGFATITQALFNHLKKQTVFEWTDDCDRAFNNVKSELVQAPALAYPDFSKPFVLETDASGVGIGCMLSQECQVSLVLHTNRPQCCALLP